MSNNGNGHEDDYSVTVLAETDNFAVLQAEDIEGEPVYSVELGSVTLHLYQDEWEELLELIKAINSESE